MDENLETFAFAKAEGAKTGFPFNLSGKRTDQIPFLGSCFCLWGRAISGILIFIFGDHGSIKKVLLIQGG